MALGGCSTIASINPFASGVSGQAATACPAAAVLRPLSQTAVFRPGAEARPTNVAFYGVLSDVEAKCTQAGGAVRASLDVVIIGERGPAAGAAGGGIDLQYFVAVTGPDQTIISKRTLPVHIDIPADARRSGVTDHIEETIPLTGRPAGELNIMLGFQQGPEVVDFYRHFRGR